MYGDPEELRCYVAGYELILYWLGDVICLNQRDMNNGRIATYFTSAYYGDAFAKFYEIVDSYSGPDTDIMWQPTPIKGDS